MDSSVQTTPETRFRSAGFFWLLCIITGTFAMVAYQKIVVVGNAAATAANITAQESLFRMSIAADLLATVTYVVATVIVYAMLAPVNRNASLLGAFFSLLGCTASAIGFAFNLAPAVILGGSKSLSAIPAEELQALAYLFIRLREQTGGISFLFFGLHCLVVGTLIAKSRFLPRVVGVLLAAGGLGWLTFSLSNLLSPQFARVLSPYILIPGILGEVTLTVWLLSFGVNLERWKARAAVAAMALIALLVPAGVATAQENPITAHQKHLYKGMKTILVTAAESMPEEKYGFKPVDGVRTFGQIVGHAADANYMFCSSVLGQPNPGLKIEKSKTAKAELVAALREAFVYCDKAYDAMTDATAAEMIARGGSGTPKIGLLTVNMVHTIEHYGNLVTYMRMNGLVPPTSDPELMKSLARH
ncbi:MAG TPA: DUF4386 family protein [Thermoanaerobaculia bacterium]|nr:DUF4386 family protein [Thermoanaerobaculia bacterium]